MNVTYRNEPLQPGLEVRLPLNDEPILAKILDPFHIQVKMPPPCTFLKQTHSFKIYINSFESILFCR